LEIRILGEPGKLLGKSPGLSLYLFSGSLLETKWPGHVHVFIPVKRSFAGVLKDAAKLVATLIRAANDKRPKGT